MNIKEEGTKKTMDAILEGIQKIKGRDITIIDLNSIDHSECGYFVICHGTSTTQVDSIAHSVEENVKEFTGEFPLHRDGYKNSLWILLDYGEIVVHVFLEQTREFYNLEGLWGDAKIEKITEDN